MGLVKAFLFTPTLLSERLTGFRLYYGDVYCQIANFNKKTAPRLITTIFLSASQMKIPFLNLQSRVFDAKVMVKIIIDPF